MQQAILTDVTKCIGCSRCVEACVAQHRLPDELPFRTYRGDGLSARRLTAVRQVPGTLRTVRQLCLHCLEPSCVAACLVGALVKRSDGPVVYKAEKCIGCRYCLLACPFNIPRYEWEKPVPFVRKCKMNEECQVKSGVPACVAACPTGATIFGERDQLLAEAHGRITSQPKLYLNRVWGEQELGGTSVLYISDVDISPVLGFPACEDLTRRRVSDLEKQSIPRFNRFWVTLTPFQAGAVFAGLWGIWFIRRRQVLMSGKGEGRPGGGSAPAPGTAGLDQVCPEPGKEGEEGSS